MATPPPVVTDAALQAAVVDPATGPHRHGPRARLRDGLINFGDAVHSVVVNDLVVRQAG